MAKSRNSGGYCGNAVETGGLSDGSGTSGRMDTEMTVSEDDTRVSGRKYGSLNPGRCGAYGVPMQVVPLSKLSARQRKDLEYRLKSELERVRDFQKKFEMQKRNGVALSSASDSNINCNNGQNRLQIDNSRKPSISGSVPGNASRPVMETSRTLSKSGSVNKLKSLDTSHKPRGFNRGSSGKFETPARSRLPGTVNALLMKDCESLLKKLMDHQYGWVFNTPVDVVKLNLPDYFTVIKHPMDLGTIKGKLATRSYTSPLEFASDIRLTFSNAMTYNPPNNDAHIMAVTLNKFFETRWKSIEKKLPREDSSLLPMKTNTREDVKNARPMPPSKKRKIASPPLQPEIIPSPQPEVIPPPAQPEVIVPAQPEVITPAKRVMSTKEKQNIGSELEAFDGDIPANILDFLRQHSSNGKDCEDELEIDIDGLSDDILFKLRKLLDDSLMEKQKNEAKVEACEIEILNDSGPSNSSLQAFKDNDPADEEVDICGIDSPVSSHPPVVIEKDTTYQTSKCSSPGSSDSDSSCSSDSESDDESRPEDLSKVPENIATGAQMDLKTTAAAARTSEISLNGLDKLDDKSQQKPNSCDSDSFQDGGCGATERQVSPDKLYRAALLKSRFADTILKAQEKTQSQGVKGDPEKMRQDKEKLEIERRKEKARLQAEAKAAEAARKRAEEAAAAEARRKRELDREAARQALLQMEKTVEINENSQFLEDLEMLRVVPAEQLPCSVDETSPGHSQDGMGGFKFGGSNPLEQLGLYIKDDYEEEEADPLCVPNPVNDVEEGEID
ncbi:unnamed protein product [Trifolium pratense]|uniref:Uncharacterized protein n=1 Tax=Trifolium pratense TaxID=57577 RepID=A0ACB0LMQ0_TRIPR|nr:unnamed protein product [Trifolium pratense]